MKHSKRIIIDIGIFIGLILMTSGYTLIRSLGDMDEIWMCNFAKCIVNGLLPYKEFNMIVTPFAPMLLAIFLKIFGEELIIIRILEIIETSTLLFITYRILVKLKIRKSISLLAVILLFNIYKGLFRFNYSWLIVIFTLIILYFEIDSRKDFLKLNVKKDFILGIIAGLAIITKQTTGLVLATCVIRI